MKSFQPHATGMYGRLVTGAGMAEGMCGLEAIGNGYASAITISALNGNNAMMAGI